MAKKILIIDDCKELCEELSEILRDESYTVCMAHDGLAGDACLREDNYDLVLLDLKMPGLGGLEVLKKLRERDNNTNVVILTARPITSDLLKTEGGFSDEEYYAIKQADGVISKPYDMNLLLGTIKKLLSEPKAE